jgi:hypothetical protein
LEKLVRSDSIGTSYTSKCGGLEGTLAITHGGRIGGIVVQSGGKKHLKRAVQVFWRKEIVFVKISGL